jgi:hypothetical protein
MYPLKESMEFQYLKDKKKVYLTNIKMLYMLNYARQGNQNKVKIIQKITCILQLFLPKFHQEYN